MSKTVDERIVQMQFDNQQFEKNVQTSMSTLDKLKQSLNFTSASKSFDNLSASAKNVDMSGLSGAVETVKSKFSAMEIVGVTALVNITNSAVNAGKRMLSALTIDPVKTGFSEYELKMDSVKTILASTGEPLEKVNELLEELNEYSDQTIYSFADMTQNIGKFTNAGVKLDDAVLAIKGISNEAAVSGANAQEASRAMYNFAQALSSGYVKLIDWKSIENANMATVEFKKELIATAEALGTVVKKGDKYQSVTTDANGKVSDLFDSTQMFNDSLSAQWMTTDVLTETLKRYADSSTDIGAKAFAAAQDVTKFTQVFDILKETAQSGWSKTWELLIGDIDQAKALLTPLTNFLSGIIDSISDFRNNLLEGALGNPFGKMFESITSKLDKIKQVTDSVSDLTGSLEYYQDIVNKVWHGDYKNADTGRYGLLDADGYDHRIVQDLVNKGLGYKLTVEDIAESQKKFGVAVSDTAEAANSAKIVLEDLSDEELKNAGLTAEEIKLYRQLAEEAKKTGKPIEELIAAMANKDGRTLLIETFTNAGQGLVAVFKAIKDAWIEIFPPMTSIQLYNIIAGLNSFSENLRVSDETADKLKRTLKGVFAIIDIITTITGGAFKIAFKVVTAILGAFNLDILDVTAYIGDAIVKFRDWVKAGINLEGVIKKIVPVVKAMVSIVGGWIDRLRKSDNIPRDIIMGIANGIKTGTGFLGSSIVKLAKFLWNKLDGLLGSFGIDTSGFKSSLKNIVTTFREWVGRLKESDNIPRDIILGLIKGLGSGIKKVATAAVDLCKFMITSIKDFLGIKSPARKFIEIARYCILGIVEGFVEGAKLVWDALRTILKKCIEIVKELDLGAVLTVALVGGILLAVAKISDALSSFSRPFEAVGDVLNATSKTLKSFSTAIKAQALLTIASAIAVLVASVIALSFIEPAKLRGSIGAIAALAVILGGLSAVMGKFGMGGAEKFDFAKISMIFISISAALLIMAIAIKKMGGMDEGAFEQGMFGIVALGAMIEVLIATSKFAGKDIEHLGDLILKISAALILMVITVKLLGGMDPDTLIQGGVAVLVFVGIVALLTLITKLAGKDIEHLGSTLIKMSAAMLIMVFVLKMLGKMDPDTLIQGGVAILVFVGIIALMTLITKIAGSKLIGDIGDTIIKFSAALLIMTAAVAILGNMSRETLIKGGIAVLAFVGIIALMVLITKLVGPNSMENLGKTLIAMALAIGIMAGAAALLGLMNIKTLLKGVGAVAVLTGMLALLVFAAKEAKNSMGSLIVITVAIALLVASVGVLSQIDGTKLAIATASLTALMGTFALILVAAKNSSSGLASLITMTAAIALMGGMLYLLSGLPTENVATVALSISGMLVAMSAALIVLSKISKVSPAAMGALALMGLIVLEIGAILAIISYFDISPSLETIGAIGRLLIEMTLVLVALSLIGPMANSSYAAMGALAVLIVGMGALIVGIGALMTEVPQAKEFLDAGIPVIEAIGTAIGKFFGNIVGGFLNGLTDDLPEVGKNIAEFMNAFADIDSDAIDGVGAVATALLSLAGANLMDTINQLIGGQSISEFSEQLIPFGECMVEFSDTLTTGNGINHDAVKAAADAGSMIADLAKSLPNEGGALGLIMGENNIDDWGKKLPEFGKAMIEFSNVLTADGAHIDQTAIEGAAAAADVMVALSKEIPNTGGVLGWIMGENNIDDWAERLPAFGKAMVEFSDILTAEGVNIDQAAIEGAASAADVMVALSKEIPNTGGVLGWIMGDNDIAKFGTKLVSFGESMVSFSNQVTGNIDTASITAASSAGTMLADLANSMPEQDGAWDNLVEFFTGSDDIDSFMDQFATFGEGIVAFSDEVRDIDNIAVQSGARAGELILNFASLIASNEAALKFFSGGQGNSSNLSSFGTQVSSFGASLKDFSSTVKGNIDQDAVDAAITAATSVAGLVEVLPDVVGKMDLGVLGTKVVTLGEGILSFSTNLTADVQSNVSGACDSAKEVIEVAKATSDIDETAFAAFVTTLGNLANNGVGKFVEAFTDSHAKVKEAAKNLLDKAIEGAQVKSTYVVKAFKNVINDILIAITGDGTANNDGMLMDFYNAGAYLLDGFVAGINANTFKAEAAAAAMASAAIEAAKEELDEHSPSRVFYGIGDYAGVAFVNALRDYVPVSYKAGSAMADSARKGLSWAVSKIADVVENDIDTQPTIRPVLDLSNIRAGANSIGGMLSVDATAVGRLSASMSGIQNGNNNSDIVSAINKLRKDIADNPRTVNNINGITYDDGSNVISAVETLVRYAGIEGRS